MAVTNQTLCCSALYLNIADWVLWRPQAIFWATHLDPGLQLSEVPEGQRKLAMLLRAPVLFSSPSPWPWTKAILTGLLSTQPWVLKPTCWALAVNFLKGKTINLDLLAKFQPLHLAASLSSSAGSALLLFPSLIPAAAMGHFPACFSRSHRFPSSAFNSGCILEKHIAAKRSSHNLNHMLG